MNKIILYSQENGNLGICIPTGELSVEQTRDKDCPNGIIVDTSVFNTIDNEFYNAYELINNQPIINIEKAKEVWKDKIRNARKSALEKLDVDFIKAQESETSTTAIVANKQTLRNLPSQVDTATSTDEIKAVWNDLLGDK